MAEVLRVEDLRVYYHTEAGPVKAVNGVSFALKPGERFGLVGESGSGKSTIALALLRLIRPPGRIEGGAIYLDGVNLVTLDEEEMRRLRLARISLVAQGAMNSLNPVKRIGEQIELALRGEPAVVFQPRSFAWEEQGPPTIWPGFAETAEGQYWATLDRALGRTPEGRVKSLEVLARWDLRPRYPELRRLTVPTLIIVGANEPQKTIELAYEWHQQYGNSEFVILPETHHAAAIENPVGWNRAVHGFLRRHGF